jgi:chorismate mutase
LSDPFIEGRRAEIAAVDRALVDAVNRRLELVAELKRYKESRAIDFVDPRQEQRILDEVVRANAGPLSDEGVRELFGHVLELMKRELRGPG